MEVVFWCVDHYMGSRGLGVQWRPCVAVVGCSVYVVAPNMGIMGLESLSHFLPAVRGEEERAEPDLLWGSIALANMKAGELWPQGSGVYVVNILIIAPKYVLPSILIKKD